MQSEREPLIQGLENHRINLAGVGSLETGNEAESGLEIRMETAKGIENEGDKVGYWRQRESRAWYLLSLVPFQSQYFPPS
jgi:hypothetical protein